jgi:hypothetical protein
MYLDMTRSLLIVPIRESDIRTCPDFTEDVVDLMPFIEFWVARAETQAG